MSEGQQVEKLEVVATVLLAYRNVLGAPQRLFRSAALPTAFSVIVSWIVLLSFWRDHPAASLFYLIYMIPMSLLALTWTRDTLFLDRRKYTPDGPWISDYLKVLASSVFWAVLLHLWPFVFVAFWLITSYGVTGGPDGVAMMMPFVPITWLGLIVVGVIPFARCFLALPLIGTKQKSSPVAAWKFGSGIGLRLGAALLLLVISLIVLAAVVYVGLTTVVGVALPLVQIGPSFYDAEYFKTWVALPLALGFVFPIGSAVSTALFAEILAITFRRVTGWTPATPGLADRFD